MLHSLCASGLSVVANTKTNAPEMSKSIPFT